MKIIHRHNSRNFTGADLAGAEKDMNDAWANYLDKKKAYDYSVSVGHASYASRIRLPEMDDAKQGYDTAKQRYDDILKSITAVNNADFTSAQQAYVNKTLTDQATGTVTKKDYSTYIYIGVGLVILLLIIKS